VRLSADVGMDQAFMPPGIVDGLVSLLPERGDLARQNTAMKYPDYQIPTPDVGTSPECILRSCGQFGNYRAISAWRIAGRIYQFGDSAHQSPLQSSYLRPEQVEGGQLSISSVSSEWARQGDNS
jgi:hypothetical protein